MKDKTTYYEREDLRDMAKKREPELLLISMKTILSFLENEKAWTTQDMKMWFDTREILTKELQDVDDEKEVLLVDMVSIVNPLFYKSIELLKKADCILTQDVEIYGHNETPSLKELKKLIDEDMNDVKE